MEQVSIQRLNLLHPAIRQDALDAYAKAVRITPVGVHPTIIQTYRSFEEQDLLYQKGRTRPGPIVTNAKPGQGFHNYRLALDFCNAINGKLVWKVDANWMKVVECFKEKGFEWGGDWRSLKDFPHLQKTLGYTWQQLLVKHKAHDYDEHGFINLMT